jgi:serine protease Do
MIPEVKTTSSEAIQTPEPQYPHRAMHLLIALVIFSLLAGAAAGFGAGFVAVKVNQHASGVVSTSRSMQQAAGALPAQDASATSGGIVDVVQQASPAVVSITVSEKTSEVNDDQGLSTGFDGFGVGDNGSDMNPYGNSPDNSSNDQAPNSSNADGYEDVAAGSGFFVTSDGLILTNKHVVSIADDAKYTVTTADGKTYDATVAATDPINDLALVKVSISNAPTLRLSDSSTIEIGQQVIAIGNSLGEYQNTVTSGIVSGIGRNVTAGSDDGSDSAEELDGVIQTDAAINPGNSGGPLLNFAGQVIGVNTAVDEEGQLVGFAIPSNFAGKDITSFQATGKIIKPFLGLSYISIDASSQKQYSLPVSVGAYITASSGSPILSGSAADKAGLKAGDIITEVNGQAIDATHTLSQLLQQFNPNDKITLNILRDGKEMNVSVTLGSKE